MGRGYFGLDNRCDIKFTKWHNLSYVTFLLKKPMTQNDLFGYQVVKYDIWESIRYEPSTYSVYLDL